MEWGTAPAWISSVGTSLSLLLAFSIIIRDRAAKRAEQARKIACWEKRPITHHIKGQTTAQLSVESHDVWMHNASGLPATDVGVLSRSLTRREVKRRYSTQQLRGFEKQSSEIGVFLSDAFLAVEGAAEVGVVMPDQTATQSLSTLEDAAVRPYVRAWISFRDVSGRGWLRDLETGRLLRAKHWSTPVRLAGGPLYFLRKYHGPRQEGYRHWLGRR